MESIVEQIKLIYIEKGIKRHPLVERFLTVFPSIKTNYIENYTHLPHHNFPPKKKFTSAKKNPGISRKQREFYKTSLYC